MVSIKPFYNLCARVMQSVGQPKLLLQNNASPHDYHLKPSDIKMIESADLVIWGGADLEGYLQKPIANANNKSLNLVRIDGLKLLTMRYSTNWASDEEEDEHDHDHHHHHHSIQDQHYWLDTNNAIMIVDAIAKQLSAIDPKHANVYHKNAADFKSEMLDKQNFWQQKLKPINKRAFIVFHDAYQYFTTEFKLNGIGSISLNPEIPPSVQRVHQIQQLLKRQQVTCIFSEPQFNNKIIESLTAGTRVKSGILDPLGRDQDLGPEGYFVLIDNLVKSFVNCNSR
jgi:zinc transport system substrate-binding protein